MLISPLTLYSYNNLVFDRMKPYIPVGIEGDDVINSILLNTAELEVLYPNPESFMNFVGVWAKSRANAWQRVYSALTDKYSAIENYDRYEDISDTSHVDTTDNTTDTRKGTTAVNSSDSITFNEGNRATTESVTGFNSNSFSNKSKTETTHATDTTTGTNESKTEAINENTIGRIAGEDRTNTRTSHIHGNIGVTTAQKMITEEIELRTKNDITHFIVEDFKRNFCILVY